jgi:hypothetical protein
MQERMKRNTALCMLITLVDNNNSCINIGNDKVKKVFNDADDVVRIEYSTGEVALLADVKSMKKYVNPDDYHNWKCDLHPRVSQDGKQVSFDSTHTGKRSLCIMAI